VAARRSRPLSPGGHASGLGSVFSRMRHLGLIGIIEGRETRIASRTRVHPEDSRKNQPNVFPVKRTKARSVSRRSEKGPAKAGSFLHRATARAGGCQSERLQARPGDDRLDPDRAPRADTRAAARALPGRGLRLPRGVRAGRRVRLHRPRPRPRRGAAGARARGPLPRPASAVASRASSSSPRDEARSIPRHSALQRAPRPTSSTSFRSCARAEGNSSTTGAGTARVGSQQACSSCSPPRSSPHSACDV
jgi:hypothetical protein